MRNRIALATILLAAIGASRPDKVSALADKDEPVALSMRKLSENIFAAYEKRDTAAIKSFYAKQSDALFFWERKMTYSWKQLDSTIDALVGAAAKLKLTTNDFRAGGSGNIGWFAATFHIERTTPEGSQNSSDGRWTVIAEKIDGRWLIVHEHTSFPLPKP